MSDIFREVDEALNREKAAKMWKEYGPLLLTAALVLILATAGGTAYRSWTSSQNQKETAKLINASEDKDSATAMEKVASDSKDGIKGIALMNAASKATDKKDFAKAADLYGKAAGDSSVPTEMRDLATIYQARALILVPDKTPDYKTLATKLGAIAKNEKSPFQLQAKLDAALVYGDGLKDYKTALSLLTGFDKDSASDSLKEKASALQHVYQFELSQSAPTPAK